MPSSQSTPAPRHRATSAADPVDPRRVAVHRPLRVQLGGFASKLPAAIPRRLRPTPDAEGEGDAEAPPLGGSRKIRSSSAPEGDGVAFIPVGMAPFGNVGTCHPGEAGQVGTSGRGLSGLGRRAWCFQEGPIPAGRDRVGIAGKVPTGDTERPGNVGKVHPGGDALVGALGKRPSRWGGANCDFREGPSWQGWLSRRLQEGAILCGVAGVRACGRGLMNENDRV